LQTLLERAFISLTALSFSGSFSIIKSEPASLFPGVKNEKILRRKFESPSFLSVLFSTMVSPRYVLALFFLQSSQSGEFSSPVETLPVVIKK